MKTRLTKETIKFKGIKFKGFATKDPKPEKRDVRDTKIRWRVVLRGVSMVTDRFVTLWFSLKQNHVAAQKNIHLQ